MVADIIRLRHEYEFVGFVDDVDPQRPETRFFGAPLFTSDALLPRLRDLAVTHLIFGFGDCGVRLSLGEAVRATGFTLATDPSPGGGRIEDRLSRKEPTLDERHRYGLFDFNSASASA